MQRIRTILQKLTDLAQRNPERSAIDVDLMLDYTRVIYADLLEMRAGMGAKDQLKIQEPTLDELTMAMAAREEEDTDDEDTSSTAATIDMREENELPQKPAEPEVKIIIPQRNEEVPKPLKPLPIFESAKQPEIEQLPKNTSEEKSASQEPKPKEEIAEPTPTIPAYAAPRKEAKDIRTYIDLNDKYLFLAELFNNDIRAYEDTMRELNRHESKQEAQHFLGAKFVNDENPAFANFQRLLDRFFE